MVDFQFVTDRLAVGGEIRTPGNMRALEKAGITHVVSMQAEFDDRRITDGTAVRVLWNGCEDDFLPKPPDLFWSGVLFTREALRDPEARVLIHCSMGIHRGPLMLLAVLRAQGYGLSQARGMISAARPATEFPAVYLESVEEFIRQYHAAPAS